jgi:cytochrome c
MGQQQFEHEGFRAPFYTWLPSIGPSNLITLHGDEFAHWRGDLLVASMKDGALWRLRIRDDELRYMERIPVGYRIRDVAEDQRGRIVLWTDEGVLVRLGRVRDGMVFTQCSGCHRTDDVPVHGIGPNLWGVVGREVGSTEGFAYSEAMRGTSGRWTPERLDAFLASPSTYLPGTAMQYAGVPDSATRATIIQYLETLR